MANGPTRTCAFVSSMRVAVRHSPVESWQKAVVRTLESGKWTRPIKL